jgi:hypothetical protein
MEARARRNMPKLGDYLSHMRKQSPEVKAKLIEKIRKRYSKNGFQDEVIEEDHKFEKIME